MYFNAFQWLICNFAVRNHKIKLWTTKLLQKSGIRKNEVIELIYSGFI